MAGTTQPPACSHPSPSPASITAPRSSERPANPCAASAGAQTPETPAGFPANGAVHDRHRLQVRVPAHAPRSEEHTSELQSREKLVCRPLLEKKNTTST